MQKVPVILILLMLVIAGCGEVESEETAAASPNRTPKATQETTPVVIDANAFTPTALPPTADSPPTAEPPPVKTLAICQVAEPDSLFLYSTNMLDKQNLFHAIYENLYTTLGYDYQAQGLVKLPRIEDGDASITAVTVQTGDLVVNSMGEVVRLQQGDLIRTHAGEIVMFDGTPVKLGQMEAHFELKPMVWSDGTAVSADDSVFSFELNRDYENPNQGSIGQKELVMRTAVYEATGELTLRWVGLPGYRSETYFLNIWMPLPRHHLENYPINRLDQLPDSARTPLSSGPFVVEDWIPGQSITLRANPHYYRSDENLPAVDQLIFRFNHDSNWIINNLKEGRCHIGTSSAFHAGNYEALAVEEEITPYIFNGQILESLHFGIQSVDDYIGQEALQDVRVRQAIAHCTNRQRFIDQANLGLGEVAHSYIPAAHLVYPENLLEWRYDPDLGNALLDGAGLLDDDGDGVRETAVGTPFQITFYTTLGAELRPAIGNLLLEDLAACGIEVIEDYLPGNEMFRSAPEGPILGRRFDTALFGWVVSTQPICHFWHSSQIPTEANDWQGNNIAGWQNEDFDAACDQARQSFWDSEAFQEGHGTAARIFADELPSLPLFTRVLVAAARPEVHNFKPDSTQPSQLWNLYEINIERQE